MTDPNSYEGLAQYGGPEQQAAGGRRTLDTYGPEELVKLQDQWFQRVTDHRRHVERQALLGTAFLMGQQYVDFLGAAQGARLIQQPPKRGRVRTVEQVIEPAYRGEMARLLRNRPTGTVQPDGTDPADFEAAQAGDLALDHVRRLYRQEQYTEEAVSWQITAGTAMLSVAWEEQTPDPSGQPGSFVFRALSPFEFGVPNIRKTRVEDQPYIMVTKTMELDEIEDRWGQRVRPDQTSSYGSLDDRLSSIIMGGHKQGSTTMEQAIVKETWVKPGPTAPAGAVLITAGGTLLDMQPWPEWTRGQYPFAVMRFIPIPGSFWGKGLLESLIPLQRRHNRAASIIIETQNMLSQIGLAVPRNTKIRSALGGKATMFEAPVGASMPITNVNPPPIGDLPFRELEHTASAVRNISYQNEVSRGQSAPGVRAASMIAMLKETDDSASTIPIRDIEQATEVIGSHVLQIIRTQWGEGRQVKVFSEEGEIERVSFISGEDVGGQYTVEAGSAWPYMRAEKQDQVAQLMELGLIDAQEGLKHLDMGATSSRIRKEREVDARHARREEQKFEQVSLIQDPATGEVIPSGEIPIPEDWHNHIAHMDSHNALRKSPRYEKWPIWKRQAYEAHITGHLAAVYAQLAQNPGMMDPGPEQPAQ